MLVRFNAVGRGIDSGRRESIPLRFEKEILPPNVVVFVVVVVVVVVGVVVVDFVVVVVFVIGFCNFRL